MLLELDVTSGENSPLEVSRVFDLLGEPRPVTRVFTCDPQGEDRWCSVAGWGTDGPCPAQAVFAEDSGDGMILLLFGGDLGIRLAPGLEAPVWSLDDPRQWGEPWLMLPRETAVE